VEIVRRQPQGQPSDPVITHPNTGRPYRHLPYSWQAVLEESGLNDGITDNRLKICWHSLRHTAASWLAIAGTDLYKVARILGHKDLRMTQRYSHLSEQSLREAMESAMS
jgi:site-specific recombinase XerD